MAASRGVARCKGGGAGRGAGLRGDTGNCGVKHFMPRAPWGRQGVRGATRVTARPEARPRRIRLRRRRGTLPRPGGRPCMTASWLCRSLLVGDEEAVDAVLQAACKARDGCAYSAPCPSESASAASRPSGRRHRTARRARPPRTLGGLVVSQIQADGDVAGRGGARGLSWHLVGTASLQPLRWATLQAGRAGPAGLKQPVIGTASRFEE